MAVELEINDHNREVELFVGRATTLFVLVVLLLGVLMLRFLDLQFWEHDTYKSRSDKNRIQVQTLAPARGMILDRDGKLLADNQNAASLALVADRLADVGGTLTLIVKLLELSSDQEAVLHKRLQSNRRPDAPLIVVESITKTQVARLAVNRHQLSGVEVINLLVRFYPYGEVAAHAVG